MAREFRVAWKREDGNWRYRRYQSRAPAERLAHFLQGNWEAAGIQKLDEHFCCDGYMCGCAGLTNREWEEQRRREVEDGEHGPGPVVRLRIDSRPVDKWVTEMDTADEG